MVTSPLPPIDVGPRHKRLVSALEYAQVEALVVSSPSNIRWLTGFSGSSEMVAVVRGSVHLFTDSRYADRAPDELRRANSAAVVSVVGHDPAETLREVLDDVKQVALEADHISWSLQTKISDEWLPDHDVITCMVHVLHSYKYGIAGDMGVAGACWIMITFRNVLRRLEIKI